VSVKASAKAVPALRKGPTREQVVAFRAHLKQGRQAASKKEWSSAIKHFESALRKIPNEARAHSELGWAAFQIGDYKKARQHTLSAIRAAALPQVKAASLYNLGRIAEASGQSGEAIGHYEDSLKLRPNESIKARIAQLTENKKPRVAPPLCWPARARQAVIECLRTHHAQTLEKREISVQPYDPSVPDIAGVEVIDVSEDMEHSYYLLSGPKEAVSIARELGSYWEGGVGNAYNEWEIEKFEVRDVSGRKVLWIETMLSGHDADYGEDEEESYSTRTLTLCVSDPVEKSHRKNPKFTCPLQFPIFHEQERTVVEEGNSFLSPKERESLSHTLSQPQHAKLDVSLSPDGKVTVRAAEGQPTPEMRAVIGTQQLWSD